VRPIAAISSVTSAVAVGGASSAVAMEPLVRAADVAAPQVRQVSLLLGILIVVGAMALVLAFVGVFAALSQSCSLRLRELGIRLALGASGPRLVATAVSREAPLVAAGIVVGVIGTLWVTAMVWRDLLLISATDPRLWIVVVGTLAAAAMLASLGPAVRALRVDPIAVLRSE
jgi:ABC-type antimicrobial peptide transport system permease subunit